MLAFLTNLNFTEMGIVLVGAIMVFGKDLPKVVMRGLQQLAKLRKAVSEMWREAGLEQEFKRVKAELQPEISEIASARKALSDGKSLLNGPVAHWRKNIGLELEDVVEADTGLGSAEVSELEVEQETTDRETELGTEQALGESEASKPKVDGADKDIDPAQ